MWIFDDTLYDFHNNGWEYTSVINFFLKRWEKYSEVIIFTGNGEEKYPEIERYLNEKGIKYVGINCDSSIKVKGCKVYANVYLDDRRGLPFMYKMLNKLIKEIEEVQK